jgi:DnaJ-class molecular chaperone
MGDIFGGGGTRSRAHTQEKNEPKEIVNLDVVRTVEIPFFDFLYDTTIDVETVYAKHLTLKVKAGTKPGTKYKISGK